MNYSQDANRKKSNPKRSKRRKRKNSVGVIILKVFIVLMVVGCFAVGGALLGAYLGVIDNAPVINTEDVRPENYTSIIYDNKGQEIDKLHGDENREYVELYNIPLDLQHAVIAIEDERFYDHNGVDFRGMLRALFVNLKNRDMSQGASTLTQQLIKNVALTSEKTLQRKIQEQYLAIKLEKDLAQTLGSKVAAKNYILELYLNTIGLNHGLNGVEAASKFYFGKSVSELNLAECASIAGITKNPSAYSPVSRPDKNKERQTLVLKKMLELGYINQTQYNTAMADDIYSRLVGTKSEDNSATVIHSYFIDYLIDDVAGDLMEQRHMNEQQAYNMIYSGGLQIYSTVDMNMQSILEESYKNDDLFPPKGNTLTATYVISTINKATQEQTHHPERKAVVNTQEEAEAFAQSVREEVTDANNEMVAENLTVVESLQSAMVVMDYHTGEVKALIGGRGEKTGNRVFNRATDALRQPGSCFKVLAAYAPAIDLNIVAPGTVIMDEPFTYNGWTPKNWYGAKYRGACTVREGIRDSLNILAAKTIINVGVDRAFEYLENFGFTSLVRSEEINGQIFSDISPATSLGGITKGVSVLELTAAYGAIANKGVYIEPASYTQVLDYQGNVLLKKEPVTRRVLKETTAYLLTDMMEDVVTGGGTGGLARFREVSMPIAGKTGTTNDDKDLTFAGYTPYYVAGIWLGYDDPQVIKYDKSYHLLLWRDVMEKLHQNLENKAFERPAGIVSRSLCSASGGAPIPGVCENDYYGGGVRTDISASDFGSSGACTYHKSYEVDLSTGKLANPYCPADSVAGVVLAVNPETDEIVNMPNPIPEDKVAIDIHETCTVHDATTAAAGEKDPEEGVIGGEVGDIPNIPGLPPVEGGTESPSTPPTDITGNPGGAGTTTNPGTSDSQQDGATSNPGIGSSGSDSGAGSGSQTNTTPPTTMTPAADDQSEAPPLGSDELNTDPLGIPD